MHEPLESRRLLSAAIVDGALLVTGTSIGDRIRIYEQFAAGGATTAYVVSIDQPLSPGPADEYTVPAEGVGRIVVRSLSGADFVDLFHVPTSPDARPLTAPSVVDAGIGNDIVYGGKGRDVVAGGFGNDVIAGGSGNDWIDGGWGDDRPYGELGNDFASGGRGNDLVTGQEGNDHLFGGPGNDTVGYRGVGPANSEEGDDYLSGGTGEDRMIGGYGTDRIYGGPGRDHWSREDDDSEMLDRTPDEPKDIPVSR